MVESRSTLWWQAPADRGSEAIPQSFIRRPTSSWIRSHCPRPPRCWRQVVSAYRWSRVSPTKRSPFSERAPGLAGTLLRASTISEYERFVSHLIDDPVARRRVGEDTKVRIRRLHGPAAWSCHLQSVYRAIAQISARSARARSGGETHRGGGYLASPTSTQGIRSLAG